MSKDLQEGRSLSPVEEIRRNLDQVDLKSSIPDDKVRERFKSAAMTAIQNSPDLISADKKSLFLAIKSAAMDGLNPDGKEAALIVFRGSSGAKVQYMPMLLGIMKRVRNSGELSMIAANIFYKEDGFKYWVDTDGEHLSHEPDFLKPRGSIVGAYALARTKDGAAYIEVMTLAELEKVRSSSKARGAGPWTSWTEEMYKKTVIKRLAKRLPMSAEAANVVHADDELFMPEKREAVIENEPLKAVESNLSNVIAAKEEDEI